MNVLLSLLVFLCTSYLPPSLALAQPVKEAAGQVNEAHIIARLGMLSDLESFGNPISPSDWLASLRAGLRDAGYIEGKNIHLEFRNGDRDPEKLAKGAAELAAMKVDIIVASSTTAAKAAKAATHTIPIVFWGAEPVSSGLVENLDHPGENLTGTTANEEQQEEFLAMLKEVVPGLKKIAILFNRSYAPVPGLLERAESGARTLGLSVQLVEVAAPGDLAGAFEAMKREDSRAVLVLNHGMFFRERAKLAALALEKRIAVSTPYLPNAEAGALIAHEADFDEVWRLNATSIAKILKGAKPGDLAVQRVSNFHYGINLSTAKTLGLTIPASILKRATVVIPDSAKGEASSAPTVDTGGVMIDPDLQKAIAARAAAERNRDIETFSRLTTDDFTLTNEMGEVITRRERIERLEAGQRQAQSQSDERIRVYGNAALRTRRITLEGKPLRMLTVWVKQVGQWKVAATQITAEQTTQGSPAEEQNRNSESEAEARRVIAAFNEAGNKRDLEGLRNALNFPYIRIASGNVRISRTREEFTSDAPPQWQAEGWHHSSVDSVEFIQSSSDKVHAAVVFSRYKADGTRYATYRTLRIITKQDGHWGVQCSSSFAP